MPKWADYVKESRERGSLAAEYFIVRSRPSAPPEKLKEVLPRHLDYQLKLQDAHKLVFAGPLSDESLEEMLGEGMMVYRATSEKEARALADADPMHAEGARSYTMRRWLINEGHIPNALRPLLDR
ncbi:YciI family protein [Hoeflea prorocentri]|uniref:YciI family protein n=1 Tax=Hoeflea prorocentri TaxID=1922333 RepID=A0A9X3UIG5_9HYPH|nr:YciI family protein [Hoeflea prorocentri]MCY6381993.1 YciI family protein [Hoeflea prorocentri]MDA5399793.1 YciI family protein [Hoeflea prorocentri]